MSRPKILGRIRIDHGQAREIKDGCTIDISPAQFRAHVKVPGSIGDLVWVQEPWFSLTPKKPFYHYGCLVGPVGRARKRLPVRVSIENSTMMQEPAKFLRRVDSCVTFEIMGRGEVGQYRCLAHFKNIDELVRARP